jgi:hypothetical protein
MVDENSAMVDYKKLRYNLSSGIAKHFKTFTMLVVV